MNKTNDYRTCWKWRAAGCRKALFMLMVLLTVGSSLFAQLATWELVGTNGASSAPVDVLAPNLEAGAPYNTLSIASGLTVMNYGPADGLEAKGQTATTLAEAITGNEYISFRIKPVAGFRMSITSLDLRPFSQNRSRSFALLSSVNGFAAANVIGTVNFSGNVGSTSPMPITVSGHANINTEVEFRIYIYGANTTQYEACGLAGSGTDVVVNGSVEPVSTVQYSLTTNTSGQGIITLNPAIGPYASGTQVTATATPATGWQFAGWSGAATGTTNPVTITMDANKTLTATFTQVAQFTLTVQVTGQGSVTLNPPVGPYNNGTLVMATAVPAAGWQFAGWSGAATGVTNPASVLMNANKTLTANFTPVIVDPILTTSVNGQGAIQLNPAGGTYPVGTVVTALAVPATGWQFTSWSGAATGTTNPVTVLMNANKTLTANFSPVTTQAIVIQGEDFTSQTGCSIRSDIAGFTGTGFVDFGGNGSFAEWNNVSITAAGTATIDLFYANGSAANRQCALLVNGSPQGNVAFAPTGDWTTWQKVTVNVPLQSGPNIIRLTANTGNGGPNFDKIEVAASSPPDPIPPSTPTNVTASGITCSSVTLSWTASTDNIGVAEYEVFRSGTLVGTTTSTSITISGLAASTSYSFTVRAKDAAGNTSGFSTALSVSTPPCDPNNFSLTTTFIPPIVAKQAGTLPTINGVDGPGEWNGAIEYPLGYEQLDGFYTLLKPSDADLSGSVALLYNSGALYGRIKRQDDVTQTPEAEMSHLNDGVDMVIKIGTLHAQLMSNVGRGWAITNGDASILTPVSGVWNSAGTIFEFRINLNGVSAGQIIGCSVSINDNDDGGERDNQISINNGTNRSSWSGQDINDLYLGTPAGNINVPDRELDVPFELRNVVLLPQINGVFDEYEWRAARKYPFVFNQLNTNSLVPPSENDISGSWCVVYNGGTNRIYGCVRRTDNITSTTGSQDAEKDGVTIYYADGSSFASVTAVVGQGFGSVSGNASILSPVSGVWSANGSVFEFIITLPGRSLAASGDQRLKFNIALNDNDGAGLETRLYPLNGFNISSTGKNMADLLVVPVPFLPTPATGEPVWREVDEMITIEVESVWGGGTNTGKWVRLTSPTGYTGSAFYRWTGGTDATPVNYSDITDSQRKLRYHVWVDHPGFYSSRSRNIHAKEDGDNDIFVSVNRGGWTIDFDHHQNQFTWSDWENDWGISCYLNQGLNVIEYAGRSNQFGLDRFTFFKINAPDEIWSQLRPESPRYNYTPGGMPPAARLSDETQKIHSVQEETGLVVFPNPSSGNVTIRGTELPVTIQISNTLGQGVRSIISKDGTVDVSDLPKGIYLLKVQNRVIRMVKE